MDVNETLQPFKPTDMDDWDRLEGDICKPSKLLEDVPRGKKKPAIHLFSGCRAR
jgi:hypothetical protein